MAISQFVDSTGTTLNKYTLTHLGDSSTEDVLLDFNPSPDYVAGTTFSAATMNPIVDVLNITTATLYAGVTSLEIVDSRITSQNVILSFYTSIYGVTPESVVVDDANNKVILTFDAQASDMVVGVKVEGTF